MQRTVTSLIQVAACTIFMLAITASAQDKKVDPAGTWKWSRPGRQGGDPVEITMKLKVEGDKITGKISQPGRGGGAATETDIKDAKLKGDEISFSTSLERGGQTRTTKYTGKISGDTIKGSIETETRNGPQKRDWEAKREKEKK